MKQRLLQQQNKRKAAVRAHYFRFWFHQTHERVFWRTADERADHTRRSKLIRTSFVHWYTCAYMLHQYKRAEKCSIQLQLRRGINRWRAWIEHRTDAVRTRERLISARIRDIGTRCLHHWMNATRLVLAERDNQARAEHAWVVSHERRAINRWKAYVATRRDDHAQEQKASALYQHMCLLRAFKQLKRNAQPVRIWRVPHTYSIVVLPHICND
jgi:hypothetical protein